MVTIEYKKDMNMVDKKKKTPTQKQADKKKKPTTSKSVPGNGLAKRAATAIEKRKKLLNSI